jgi:predicted enzyme related to lactoylglutathione lyase
MRIEGVDVTTVQPIITTAGLARLQTFYETLLGAVEVRRFPGDGPVFFVSLKLGDSELGLVDDTAADLSAPQRILLSVDVDDVDGLLDRVEAVGGRVLGPSTDMPWGQRVAHVHDPDGNMVNLTQSLQGSVG